MEEYRVYVEEEDKYYNLNDEVLVPQQDKRRKKIKHRIAIGYATGIGLQPMLYSFPNRIYFWRGAELQPLERISERRGTWKCQNCGKENAVNCCNNIKLEWKKTREVEPLQNGEREDKTIFMKSMGIVSQIFDYLIEEGIDISVDFRQKHNDKLDDYVFKCVNEMLSQSKKEILLKFKKDWDNDSIGDYYKFGNAGISMIKQEFRDYINRELESLTNQKKDI